MSGRVADPVGSKDPSVEIQISPSPQPEYDLEGGPKDTNAPACSGSPTAKPESHTQLANGLPPGGIRPPGSRSSGQIGNNVWKPRQLHQWKSPLAMLVFFVTGLGMSVGHCVFNARLNGSMVGSSYSQESNLR
jgi:hypothetical protein